MHRCVPPPPESFDAYSKKSEESNGIIARMDASIKELDKEMTEAEVEEKDAQADYEHMMKDSADKRAEDFKACYRNCRGSEESG